MFSDKKNGPTFRHEKAVRGIFQHGNTTVKIQMSVSETANVYCQTLMDCSPNENVGIKNLGFNSHLTSWFSTTKELDCEAMERDRLILII